MRRRGFYSRLAARNIVKNKRFFLPYILTCVFSAAMMYIMVFIATDDYVAGMKGAGSLIAMLVLGCVIIGIFSTIILFYANGFLMKRRKKELGLYNILGMEKRHIARLMARETLFTAIVSIIGGIGVGILFSKLVLLLLVRLVRFDVQMGFSVSLPGILVTVILFAVIFVMTLIVNLIRVKLSNPMELLRGGQAGEREPKTKWVLAAAGLVTMGLGYYIALTVKEPIAAIGLFFIAVILVICGTYFLFTAGSIAILKLLRRNKQYYYKTKHFVGVSGMLYRMKQNAAGLASICILCTMVLVTVSTTVCLYAGAENTLDRLYPKDISYTLWYNGGNVTAESIREAVGKKTAEAGLTTENVTEKSYLAFYAVSTGSGGFSLTENNSSQDGSCRIIVVTPETYNETAGLTALPGPGEALAFMTGGNEAWDSVSIGGTDLGIAGWIEPFTLPEEYLDDTADTNDTLVLVTDGDTLSALCRLQEETYGGDASCIKWEYSFDLSGDGDRQKLDCYEAINAGGFGGGSSTMTYRSRQDAGTDFYAAYGGFLFLGIFLGLLFLVATALIIYYKQLSEGYDDAERFEIMQKVGMSRDETKACVKGQILTVFFLPLGVSAIHVAGSFRMITKMLTLFGLTDIGLFAVCCLGTLAVFALAYCAIYVLTAKVYYSIVRT